MKSLEELWADPALRPEIDRAGLPRLGSSHGV